MLMALTDGSEAGSNRNTPNNTMSTGGLGVHQGAAAGGAGSRGHLFRLPSTVGDPLPPEAGGGGPMGVGPVAAAFGSVLPALIQTDSNTGGGRGRKSFSAMEVSGGGSHCPRSTEALHFLGSCFSLTTHFIVADVIW